MKGIWIGMITGTVAQTCVLLILTYRTNWDKEASAAEDRIRKWGGKHDDKGTMNGRRREGEEHDDAEARGRPGSRGTRVRNTTTQRREEDSEQRCDGEEHDDAEAFGRLGAEA
ncbi:hypothetical protein Scep_030171 [Stephania cephalantha]|uniref:Protein DETOXIFICATION n=1 Tax=Stephania cephalantha TaxID=152367 RepID=A0AAP0HIB0_9MAGN